MLTTGLLLVGSSEFAMAMKHIERQEQEYAPTGSTQAFKAWTQAEIINAKMNDRSQTTDNKQPIANNRQQTTDRREQSLAFTNKSNTDSGTQTNSIDLQDNRNLSSNKALEITGNKNISDDDIDQKLYDLLLNDSDNNQTLLDIKNLKSRKFPPKLQFLIDEITYIDDSKRLDPSDRMNYLQEKLNSLVTTNKSTKEYSNVLKLYTNAIDQLRIDQVKAILDNPTNPNTKRPEILSILSITDVFRNNSEAIQTEIETYIKNSKDKALNTNLNDLISFIKLTRNFDNLEDAQEFERLVEKSSIFKEISPRFIMNKYIDQIGLEIKNDSASAAAPKLLSRAIEIITKNQSTLKYDPFNPEVGEPILGNLDRLITAIEPSHIQPTRGVLLNRNPPISDSTILKMIDTIKARQVQLLELKKDFIAYKNTNYTIDDYYYTVFLLKYKRGIFREDNTRVKSILDTIMDIFRSTNTKASASEIAAVAKNLADTAPVDGSDSNWTKWASDCAASISKFFTFTKKNDYDSEIVL